MSAVLWPITEAGSLDRSSDLLRYAQRDFYGVEAIAASATDFRGFNEMTAWTRRVEAAALGEHAAPGVHNTVKVARQIITLAWDGVAVTVVDVSYGQDTSTATRLYGSAVATVSRAGAGLYDVTLIDPMPVASGYKLIDFSRGNYDFTSAPAGVKHVRVMLMSITNATQFRVGRFQGTNLATLALADGSACFALHS